MKRDKSRDDLAANELWNIVDYIPDILGAPLRKRGGWEYHGSALTSLDASAELPTKVIVAPFANGTKVLAVDGRSDCELFNLTDSTNPGSIYGAASGQPRGTPVFYRNLVIFPTPNSVGGGAPRKFDGSTISALGGSPPDFQNPNVYKDRLVVVRTPADEASPAGEDVRLYFSGAGNPESWDTTNRFIDTSAQVVATASLRNVLLVFHGGSVERIRGSIPPGSAAANMELEPLFGDVGLIDSDALVVADEYAYFADENGVYQTDGSSKVDLTQQGGISQFWRSQFATVGSSGSVALTAWRGYIFVSLQTSSDVFVDFLVCEIASRSWFRFSNIRAYNFATQYGTTDEVYFSNRDTSSKRVGKLSGVFSPASGVKNDADGDAVVPVIETGVFNLDSFYLKQFTDVYLSYDIRDAASDNPILTMSYLVDPAETSYTALSPTFAETTTRTRSRVPLNQTKYGVALKISQSNASSDTRVYGLEADVTIQEGSDLV